MITMSAKKLWVLVVVSGLAVACTCDDAAGRKTSAADEEQVYKNHRTSKNNDTAAQLRHKYPVYPAQVYANLSNARDFTTVKPAEQAGRTTEASPTDEVRVFITPAPGAANKRTKPDGRATGQQQQQGSAAAPSVYFVTSKSVQTAESSTPAPAHKTPVYSSPPSPQQANGAGGPQFLAATATKEAADFRASPPTVAGADEANRKLKFNNGTKIRRVLKAQHRLKQAALLQQQQQQQQQQQPTVLLSATSTAAPSPLQSSPQQMQTFVGGTFVAQQGHRNNATAAAAAAAGPGPAAYPVTAKVANSSGPSKPFATVLVPKQMLEGNGGMLVMSPQDYSSSFRPIAGPVQYASYRPSVDTNAIAENRRVSTEAKTQTVAAAKAQSSTAAGTKAQSGAAAVVKAQSGAAAATKTQTGVATKTKTKTQADSNKVQSSAGVPSGPKVSKFGFVKQPQATYKVEEFVPGDRAAASVTYDKRFNGMASGYKNDRSDQTVFVPAERREVQEKPVRAQQVEVQEKPVRVQQLESALAVAAVQQRFDPEPSKAPQEQQPKPNVKYGFSVPDSYSGHDLKKQTVSKTAADVQKQQQKQQQQQFREYYPATETTPAKEAAAASYPKYDSAGKFDMRPAGVEMVAGPPFVLNSRPGIPFEVSSRPAIPLELNSRPPMPFEVNSRPAAGPPSPPSAPSPSFELSNRQSFEFDSRPPSSYEIDSRPPSSYEIDSRPPASSLGPSFDMGGGRPSSFDFGGRPPSSPFELDSRPPSSGPSKEMYISAGPPNSGRYSSLNAGSESSSSSSSSRVPEVVLGDVNPKDVLKSLLLDMLKGKQLQSETSSKTTKLSAADDTFDSFFKVSRPNIDYSADNYDIETDMSCNLRSTKYITDGQCVTTKPVVEAVCADRCLVYASSMSQFGVQRQRSSPTANQQVEALHCVDGDSKLVRVQLHCRDGNTLNNVIKVVTNCRCKLHQVQPQMRSNSQSLPQEMGMVNPDIMSIAAGTY